MSTTTFRPYPDSVEPASGESSERYVGVPQWGAWERPIGVVDSAFRVARFFEVSLESPWASPQQLTDAAVALAVDSAASQSRTWTFLRRYLNDRLGLVHADVASWVAHAHDARTLPAELEQVLHLELTRFPEELGDDRPYVFMKGPLSSETEQMISAVTGGMVAYVEVEAYEGEE